MIGVLLDGMMVVKKRVTIPQAHFACGSLDLGAMSGPERFGMGEDSFGQGSCS